MLLVYRYRVKSRNGLLNQQARAVNCVWNFCNDRQKDALRFGRKWLTGFDLNRLTIGSSRDLGIHSGTVNAVCEQYAKSRTQKRRPCLRYRGANSLGWVPLKGRNLEETPEGFRFHSKHFRVFKSRNLPVGAAIKDGTNFAQDACGNWFLNVCVEIDEAEARPQVRGIGIDLGLKDLAVLSNGERLENPRHFRRFERALGRAQRAHKKRQVTKLHARIANARRDHLHKAALNIVRRFDYIAAGNVDAAGLARTSLAKSVLDAGWSSFRRMLAYKAIRHGAIYEEVSEAYTTQTCHECASIAGPRGQTGLNERNWICVHCGTELDRDVNAALNILLRRSGHRAPAEGIPTLRGGEDVNASSPTTRRSTSPPSAPQCRKSPAAG
jgi:IS605 OrfB family transposase